MFACSHLEYDFHSDDEWKWPNVLFISDWMQVYSVLSLPGDAVTCFTPPTPAFKHPRLTFLLLQLFCSSTPGKSWGAPRPAVYGTPTVQVPTLTKQEEDMLIDLKKKKKMLACSLNLILEERFFLSSPNGTEVSSESPHLVPGCFFFPFSVTFISCNFAGGKKTHTHTPAPL